RAKKFAMSALTPTSLLRHEAADVISPALTTNLSPARVVKQQPSSFVMCTSVTSLSHLPPRLTEIALSRTSEKITIRTSSVVILHESKSRRGGRVEESIPRLRPPAPQKRIHQTGPTARCISLYANATIRCAAPLGKSGRTQAFSTPLVLSAG